MKKSSWFRLSMVLSYPFRMVPFDGETFVHFSTPRSWSFETCGLPCSWDPWEGMDFSMRPGSDHRGVFQNPPRKCSCAIWKKSMYTVYVYFENIYNYTYIYIYPQTGTFADPETHPLRGFGPFCRGRVLAFVLFLLDKVLRNGLLRYILYTCPSM